MVIFKKCSDTSYLPMIEPIEMEEKHKNLITINYWQPWCSGWRYVPYLRCVQGRKGTREGITGGRRGGAKRRNRNNFGPPWKTQGKIKGGVVSVGIWARSRKPNRKGEGQHSG